MTERTYTWADLEAAVGEDFSDGDAVIGADIVDRSGIRRLCEVIELGCPLHWDEDAAKAYGYPGLLMPVSGINTSYTIPAVWSPGQPTRWREKDPHGLFFPPLGQGNSRPLPMPPTSYAFATDFELESFRPFCVGDQLTRTGNVLVSALAKETSVGFGAFVVTQSDIHNQRGELVARLRHGGFRYNPHPPEKLGTRPAPAAPAELRPTPPASEPRADWGESLRWHDVQEGDAIPAVSIILTIQRLVMAAGANRDFNAVHHDTLLTQQTGVREIYANNGFIQAFWERTVREYIGCAGRIVRLGPFRMRSFNHPGQTVTTQGTVKRKYQRDGQNLLELTLWSENDLGVSVGPGSVTVALPA